MNGYILGLKEGLKEFSLNIMNLVVTLALLLVYLIGFSFTSVYAKLSGKILLDKKISNESSYWKELNLSKKSKDSYYRQF